MKLERLYESGAMPIHLGAACLCVVMLGGGWLFGLSPLMSDTQKATTVIDQAEQAEFEAKQAKSKLDRLATELATVQQRLEDQPVNLQAASDINPLLADLARWSEGQGLSITNTNAGRPVSLAYYDYVPITVAGEGAYTDLLAFFKRLHGERGDLGLITFNATRLTSGAGVEFEIELAWYVISDDTQGEPQEPGQATASAPTG